MNSISSARKNNKRISNMNIKQQQQKAETKQQSSSKVPKVVYESIVRRQMIHLIETKLRLAMKQNTMMNGIESCDNSNNDKTAPPPSVKFAPIIEKYLYKQAATFEEYSDRNTLKQRVKIASLKIIKRRLASKNESDRRKRQSILRKTVGEEKYDRMMNLKNQIQSLRLQLCASSTTSCNNNVSPCDNDERLLTPKQTPSKKITTVDSQDNNIISSPVRSLFFNIQLLHEIEFASTERIPKLDWDDMIERANNTIESYKKWTPISSSTTTRTKSTLCYNSDSDTLSLSSSSSSTKATSNESDVSSVVGSISG